MRRRATVIYFFILFFASSANTRAQTIPQQAYVWQRDWSPAVVQAVHEQKDALTGLTILAAEITPSANGNRTVNVVLDYPALLQTQLPIMLAIRVGGYPGPFTKDADTTQVLLAAVSGVLANARAAGLEPAAIEIDFDCATSKLGGYRHWLTLLREPLDGVPLSITTLPTWMHRTEAFAALVEAADHFVLQVHSIQRPSSSQADISLCNAEQARIWVDQAAIFGQPFHVALPTYAYQIAFDAEGQLVEVAGENALPAQNPAWTYRTVRADPQAMTALVNDLSANQPTHCEGIIWYRLPVAGDQLNWDAATWRAVMAGQANPPSWQLSAVPQPDGAVEIQIEQTSPIAAPPPAAIVAHWAGAKALAWDGQRHYAVDAAQPNQLTWQRADRSELLPQGTRWTLGWVRFDQATELELSLNP